METSGTPLQRLVAAAHRGHHDRPVWAAVFTIAHNKLADRRAYATRPDTPVGDETITAAVADPRPEPHQLIEDDEEA
jgi:hypothetical protein